MHHKEYTCLGLALHQLLYHFLLIRRQNPIHSSPHRYWLVEPIQINIELDASVLTLLPSRSTGRLVHGWWWWWSSSSFRPSFHVPVLHIIRPDLILIFRCCSHLWNMYTIRDKLKGKIQDTNSVPVGMTTDRERGREREMISSLWMLRLGSELAHSGNETAINI